MRTSELRRSIPEITERMLIRHLHELVRDGILRRHQESTIPPCVRYSISEYGLTLAPVLEVICDWGRTHLRRMNKACIVEAAHAKKPADARPRRRFN